MKQTLCMLMLIAVRFCAQSQQPLPACPAEQSYSSMYLTFASEFTQQTQLDPSQWRIYVGQHGPADQESNVYLPNNVHLSWHDGLNLQIEHKSVWDHPYTAGWIETRGRFAQTYGHYEMLARVPQANGVWPAFWLAAENGTWPPEIDILEYVFAPHGLHPDPRNSAPQSVPETTLHWVDNAGKHQFQHAGVDPLHPRYHVGLDWDRTPPLPGLDRHFSGYHLYAIDWRPGSIVWLIDHRPVFCMADDGSNNRRIPDMPMYLILSDSVAPVTQKTPHWAGHVEDGQAFPLNYTIAYVRAYQFKEVAPQPLPLDLLRVVPATQQVKAGQTVSLHVALRVANADLGKGKVALSAYALLDPHQFYGMGERVAEVDAALPELQAQHTYEYDLQLSFPSSLAPGIYGIDVKVNYTAGPGNMLPGEWPRGIHDRQAATLTITQ